MLNEDARSRNDRHQDADSDTSYISRYVEYLTIQDIFVFNENLMNLENMETRVEM